MSAERLTRHQAEVLADAERAFRRGFTAVTGYRPAARTGAAYIGSRTALLHLARKGYLRMIADHTYTSTEEHTP